MATFESDFIVVDNGDGDGGCGSVDDAIVLLKYLFH